MSMGVEGCQGVQKDFKDGLMGGKGCQQVSMDVEGCRGCQGM